MLQPQSSSAPEAMLPPRFARQVYIQYLFVRPSDVEEGVRQGMFPKGMSIQSDVSLYVTHTAKGGIQNVSQTMADAIGAAMAAGFEPVSVH